MKKHHRWKGAISIFLCIILISNTALVGVLVDSARYRMARAESEAALDSAASSVLSYYNKMLYDLYGLFATDSLSEEEITRLLQEYTEKTLGVAEVPESSVKQINQAIYTALTGQAAQEADLASFTAYDYEINVTMDPDRVSLANTDAVESQIIDHMKYRAPISLVSGVGDFLEKISVLFDVVDRIEAAKDKADSEKELGKEQLANDAAALIQRISEFNAKLKKFTNCPYDLDKGTGETAMDPWDLVREFDENMDRRWADFAGEEEQPEDEMREVYRDELNMLLGRLANMSGNANDLHNEANQIRDSVDSIMGRYDTYIAALQAKIDADPNNENLKTVYLPEIELAESTCGEILKNMDLVLMGRQYTDRIAGSMMDYQNMFEITGEQVIDTRLLGLERGQTTEEGYSIYITDMIEREVGEFAGGCNTLLAETAADLDALNVFARDFEEAKPVKVKTLPSDSSPSKEETDPEVAGLRPFNAEDLKVSYETTQQVDWDHELNTEVDAENVSQILQGGLDFIRKLGEVLEGARDSLYINEYAIAYFPNYVQHYRAVDKAIATEADNKYLSPKSNSYYVPYLASQAELEYIISGNSNAGEAVLDVAARLLGIRMVLNTAAIFTDSAKIAQANTMAAAISGPFAPLVATGLLIAWALAESTFDVLKLQEGEEVLVFKQGSNWFISAGGLVREAVGAAAEYVTEEVTTAANNAISDAAAAVQQAANKAVYDAYQKLSSGADAAVSAAQSSMQQWGQEISSQVPEASAVLNNATTGVTDTARNAINNTLTDAKDQALALVNQTVRNTSKNMQDGVDKLGAQIQEKVTKAVTSALAKVLPEGQVQNTGSNTGKFDVKMDYMDYMRIFLLFMDNTTKVQHIQSLVQANLRCGKQEDFSMEGSFVTVSASMEGSVNYLMMGSGFLPASMQRDGRLKFKVYTNLGY